MLRQKALLGPGVFSNAPRRRKPHCCGGGGRLPHGGGGTDPSVRGRWGVPAYRRCRAGGGAVLSGRENSAAPSGAEQAETCMVRCIVPLCADVETEMTHAAAPSADGPVGRYPRLVMPAAAPPFFYCTIGLGVCAYFSGNFMAGSVLVLPLRPLQRVGGVGEAGSRSPRPFHQVVFSNRLACFASPSPIGEGRMRVGNCFSAVWSN